MQNFSILQLLKTLSAVQGTNSSPHSENITPKEPKKTTSPSVENREEKGIEPHSVSPADTQDKSEKYAYAYENFLTRHQQAVQRVRERGERK